MKKLILLTAIFPLLALADPGPATRYLMNQPASLMDIGLIRANRYLDRSRNQLEKKLKEQGDENAFVLAAAKYDFDNDIIGISFSILLGVFNATESNMPKFLCSSRLTMGRALVASSPSRDPLDN